MKPGSPEAIATSLGFIGGMVWGHVVSGIIVLGFAWLGGAAARGVLLAAALALLLGSFGWGVLFAAYSRGRSKQSGEPR